MAQWDQSNILFNQDGNGNGNGNYNHFPTKELSMVKTQLIFEQMGEFINEMTVYENALLIPIRISRITSKIDFTEDGLRALHIESMKLVEEEEQFLIECCSWIDLFKENANFKEFEVFKQYKNTEKILSLYFREAYDMLDVWKEYLEFIDLVLKQEVFEYFTNSEMIVSLLSYFTKLLRDIRSNNWACFLKVQLYRGEDPNVFKIPHQRSLSNLMALQCTFKENIEAQPENSANFSNENKTQVHPFRQHGQYQQQQRQIEPQNQEFTCNYKIRRHRIHKMNFHNQK